MSARRVSDDPVRPAAEPTGSVTVDGEPVPLRAGETVAACLLAADRLTLRRTRHGHRPRGVFCGIGVCFDCLVTVNGVAGVRACLRQASSGDRIETGVTS